MSPVTATMQYTSGIQTASTQKLGLHGVLRRGPYFKKGMGKRGLIKRLDFALAVTG
jgi:hypothetical protein